MSFLSEEQQLEATGVHAAEQGLGVFPIVPVVIGALVIAAGGGGYAIFTAERRRANTIQQRTTSFESLVQARGKGGLTFVGVVERFTPADMQLLVKICDKVDLDVYPLSELPSSANVVIITDASDRYLLLLQNAAELARAVATKSGVNWIKAFAIIEEARRTSKTFRDTMYQQWNVDLQHARAEGSMITPPTLRPRPKMEALDWILMGGAGIVTALLLVRLVGQGREKAAQPAIAPVAQ